MSWNFHSRRPSSAANAVTCAPPAASRVSPDGLRVTAGAAPPGAASVDRRQRSFPVARSTAPTSWLRLVVCRSVPAGTGVPNTEPAVPFRVHSGLPPGIANDWRSSPTAA